MSNIYQQIVDMELQDLENELSNIQNELIGYNIMLDEVWQYHPANPDFLNPIKAYDELKKSIISLESKLSDLELKINHLKSMN